MYNVYFKLLKTCYMTHGSAMSWEKICEGPNVLGADVQGIVRTIV